MSKYSNVGTRFKDIELGVNEKIVNVRIKGLQGKDIERMFRMIDDKDNSKAMEFVTLLTMQKDDPTATKEDFEKLDMQDILNIANACTEQSGLGKIFDIKNEKKLEGEDKNLNNKSSQELKIISLRKKLAEKETLNE